MVRILDETSPDTGGWVGGGVEVQVAPALNELVYPPYVATAHLGVLGCRLGLPALDTPLAGSISN